MRKKYAFAGASSRGLQMFCQPMFKEYADVCEAVGVFDLNLGRAQEFVKESGGSFPVFEDFDQMIAETKPDVVVVTTTDVFHSDYIIRAMELGCDVVSEKPMTTTDDRCRAILATEKKTGKHLTISFNYRYMPLMTKVKELMVQKVIGEPLSVHFEWMLTQNMDNGAHGTSYFRRWNARMAMSSGLLVHKSTHHFDLVNWWLDDHVKTVTAFGKLNMYGAKNSPWPDVPSEGLTCRTCKHASECRFYHELDAHEKEYYAAFEKYDSKMPNASISLKDNCIYAADIDIYDTMAVNAEYEKGTLMTYSLNATTPYEGWRCIINGTKGRIEAIEYDTSPMSAEPYKHVYVYGPNDSMTDYKVAKATGSHGGGDARILDRIFRGGISDPLGHEAGSMDGAYSILVGVAANKSIKEKTFVNLEDLLKD